MTESFTTISKEQIDFFITNLYREEKSPSTIEKYRRDAFAFYNYLADEKIVSKEVVQNWKAELLEQGYKISSINSMIAAVNSFLDFIGASYCRVKQFKCQRQLFRDKDRNLTKEEFFLLVNAAQKKGDERLQLLLQTICGTGIRVSEVQYITFEAVKTGRTIITLKGKTRTIFLPNKLCRKLLRYAQRQNIAHGPLFITQKGNCLSRKTIWAEMKKLCAIAGVEPSKVFPHNLRHLFAQTFYAFDHDIAELADVLGHSSIETTRIYVLSTGEAYSRKLERLGFVV